MAESDDAEDVLRFWFPAPLAGNPTATPGGQPGGTPTPPPKSGAPTT